MSQDSKEFADVKQELADVKQELVNVRQELSDINKKLDIIIAGSQKLDRHIDFVEQVYSVVKKPLYYFVNKINYITN